MSIFRKKFFFAVITSALSSSVFATPQLFTIAEKGENAQDEPLLRSFQGKYKDYKLVNINKDLLLNRASTFVVNLDSESTPIEIQGKSFSEDNTGSDIWQGESENEKASVSFSIRNGNINGGIQLSNGSYYEILPVSQDQQILVKVDTSEHDIDDDDAVEDKTPLAQQRTLPEAFNENEYRSASNEQARVRLLYVYTNQSRHWFMPDPANKVSSINAELNKTYSNSDTLVQFDIAGVLDTNMDESTMNSMLSQMQKTNTALGKLVAEKRAETRADLVVILSEAYQSCGLSQKDKWATVVHTTCAVGVRTLAHEIGHNFGLNHGEKELTWPSYAHGYRVPGYFSTIMSKRCNCEAINNFSDPLKSYKGVPIGTAAGNDAVRLIRERRFVMAAMYPDWESQRQLNDGNLPQNQYFEVTLTEGATNKKIIRDEIVTRPALRDWPYDISVAVNKYFPNDVVMAGGLDSNIVKPIAGTSYQNHIWLHQDKIGAYKVDVQRKTYAVVRDNKWADVMAISGGDGLAANATVMLTIKNKTSGQALEKYYFNNGDQSLAGTSWPHHLAQTINSHNSANVIAGELKDDNFNTVTGSGYRNRLWFPLDKKNDLTAEFTTLSIAENPWVEQKDIFGDKFQTDLAPGTVITVVVKSDSGAVAEQLSISIPDSNDRALLSRYRWPAYLAHEINKSMTQIRLGGEQADGSVKVVEWSQYKNLMWKKERANQTVVVTFD
ncbi:zinc-dependent metalloprotease family protein [Pantoea sp.]|uniref:zinc-dependent metalloprotease family protein n=1 Tax=Pantoea sp. TaxID=69393 RepID=UPI0028A8F52D|nr:zinc-dependent metalloprotease family protein [Pantoea sp.]